MQEENSNNSTNLPDKKKCQIKNINSEKIAECLTKGSIFCSFSVNFAEKMFCTHSNWKSFLQEVENSDN